MSEEQETRERWPSRLSFVLASMGGAVGIGNLLRYPSIAARHYGLQWFIPYFLALFLIGIPILALEISLGQSMRGAAVVANGAVHRRLRGLGAATALISLITATYYVVIMAWVLSFFRHSFVRPLPWLSDTNFFLGQVVQNVDSVRGSNGFLRYPGTGVVGETLGWSVLTWVVVYLCIFRGVAITGRVVYVTMLVPLLLCIALLVRAVTLPRARDGIILYVGRWRSDVITAGEVWRDAIIQIFFSIGTGFGYFIAYSSYNSVSSNAVQDVLIIALSNSFIEVVIGFAAFAVVGFLKIDLSTQISSFTLGFITYPAALGNIPGGNAWSVFFFLTVYLLAVDSAFALLESFISCITDTDWGGRLPKPVTVAIISVIAMCLSFLYSAKFGLRLLDAMDYWVTGITLSFVTWFQCVAVTGMYRYKDVISQTGMLAFAGAQTSYIGSMVLGVIVGRFASFWWGVLTFALILVIGTLVSTALGEHPQVRGSFGMNPFLNKLWWLTSYSVRISALYSLRVSCVLTIARRATS